VARKTPPGLEYFPLSVDLFDDDKIQFVNARFGHKGELLVLKLLCKIYKDKGYFMSYTEDESLLFANRVGFANSLVNDVVEELIKRDFFDKYIFSSFKVLTSRAIQTKYFEAVIRRKKIYVFEELLIVDLKCIHDVYIKALNVYISSLNVNISTHSRVEYSKVKESKVEESISLEEKNEKVNDAVTVPSLNFVSTPTTPPPNPKPQGIFFDPEFLQTEWKTGMEEWKNVQKHNFKLSKEELENRWTQFLVYISATEDYKTYQNLSQAKRHFVNKYLTKPNQTENCHIKRTFNPDTAQDTLDYLNSINNGTNKI
jgi:hypothetical protein